jgi:hypothetical protein
MLLYVPYGYVALVYLGSELRDVLEAGVADVAPLDGLTVHYVDLQAAASAPQDGAALELMH